MWTLEAINNMEFYEDGVGYNCDFDFPYLHNHDYWEFQYVYSPIRHVLNGETIIVKNHSVMVIKPSDSHSVSARGFVENKGKSDTMLNLKITVKELESLLNNYLPDCIKKMEQYTYEPVELNDEDILFCEKWLKALEENPQRRAKISCIKILILFVFLKYADGVMNLEKLYENIPERIVALKNRLTAPEYFDRNISEIVAEFGYSRAQAGRAFKRYYNQTMYEYVTNAKMAYARKMLSFSECSILEVAEEIGYSLSQFYRVFKECYDLSPNEYKLQTKLDAEMKKQYEQRRLKGNEG